MFKKCQLCKSHHGILGYPRQLWRWLCSLFVGSVWIYRTELCNLSCKATSIHTDKDEVRVFHISRSNSKRAGIEMRRVEYQIACGSWSLEHNYKIKTFHDARAAEKHTHRLQKGIKPSRKRIAGAVGIVIIVVEALALFAVCGGHP